MITLIAFDPVDFCITKNLFTDGIRNLQFYEVMLHMSMMQMSKQCMFLPFIEFARTSILQRFSEFGLMLILYYQSQELIDYYNCSTTRDWAGRPISFDATASIADGLAPILHKSAPQVALFSSRGPDVKDFSFQDADVLKPDILAPGNLIWAAWAPNGTDEANYIGKCA